VRAPFCRPCLRSLLGVSAASGGVPFPRAAAGGQCRPNGEGLTPQCAALVPFLVLICWDALLCSSAILSAPEKSSPKLAQLATEG
ncbi:unnamed protein product, partial [Amoebophrya sp. A120]